MADVESEYSDYETAKDMDTGKGEPSRGLLKLLAVVVAGLALALLAMRWLKS